MENSPGADSTSQPIYLPDEIILQILSYVDHQPTSQKTLASCARLSRQWYSTSIPLLYQAPKLYGHNFDTFVRTLCPSVIAHVHKTPLSELVKILDMSGLVHQGSKSMTARLLGRTKGNLQEFRAPQASFAINCLPALSKCSKLRVLDLSLVSESPPLPDLLRTTASLKRLQSLKLPRSSGFGIQHKTSSFSSWPQNLQDLTLSGGVDAHFLHGIVALPSNLRHLTIEHCPKLKGFAVMHLLKNAVRPLQMLNSVRIANMPNLNSHALDSVLFVLPQLQHLSVSVDYITPALFDATHFYHSPDLMAAEGAGTDGQGKNVHAHLRSFELTNSHSPSVSPDKLTPIDILLAIDEGTLPRLRRVRVVRSLMWLKEDMEALLEVLVERTKTLSDDVLEEDRRDKAGVWVIEG